MSAHRSASIALTACLAMPASAWAQHHDHHHHAPPVETSPQSNASEIKNAAPAQHEGHPPAVDANIDDATHAAAFPSLTAHHMHDDAWHSKVTIERFERRYVRDGEHATA